MKPLHYFHSRTLVYQANPAGPALFAQCSTTVDAQRVAQALSAYDTMLAYVQMEEAIDCDLGLLDERLPIFTANGYDPSLPEQIGNPLWRRLTDFLTVKRREVLKLAGAL